MGSRIFNRTTQLLVDILVLAGAYLVAYVVRFEASIPPVMLRTLAWTLPYVVALQYCAMILFRVHRMAWRYVGLPDMRNIAAAVGLSTLVLLLVRFVTAYVAHSNGIAARAIVPIGVILISSTFAFLGIAGVRVVRRMLAERQESDSRTRPRTEPIPTMLIGAGRAGVLVAKEIGARPDLGIRPVGFLDDDPVKLGTVVHGVAVLGSPDQLAELCAKRGAKQALITVAAAGGKEIRRIKDLCDAAHIPVKIIPGLFEIVGGKVNLSRIRTVAIEDLLGRDTVHLDEEAINGVVRERVVLVTGAGGSIGSELCRQICTFSPKALVLVDHAENNLFHIERELRAQHPTLPLYALIADIRDRVRMAAVLAGHRPHAVFHAAAHKHVPMMEQNPGEAIKNNVLGTKTLAELADAHGVSEFVMISTDKAVNPTSVMGASKRAAEIFVQALSQRSKTRFVAVRFGNVLGSAGSVVPIFQEQIARGGPVTVTDPEMKRYFMTIPEACQLVLQAGSMGRGGEIFVLDMGEPVKIVDLARDLIKLSGLREGEDIEIEFTGARPGEKLFEELSLEDEGAEKTRHPKVFIGRIKPHPWADVLRHIAELEAAAEGTPPPERIRELFARFVPEYRPAVGAPSLAPKQPAAVSAPPKAEPRSTPHVVLAAGEPT
jgi:FlaA1/EpsC-like NDP-sugar epimerase